MDFPPDDSRRPSSNLPHCSANKALWGPDAAGRIVDRNDWMLERCRAMPRRVIGSDPGSLDAAAVQVPPVGMRLAMHCQAARDADHLSRDEGRFLAGKKRDDTWDIVRLAEPPHRNGAPKGL